MDTRYSMLSDLRNENDKTQADVAKVLGIRTNMYQRYEYGKLELPVRHAKKLGAFYEIDWWKFYEELEE